MVLSTSDPDALEEVWFVLSKAMGSSNNAEIRRALKYGVCFLTYCSRIADYLIKNTGAQFHNTCTPLFMRRLKEMILVRLVSFFLMPSQRERLVARTTCT